MRNSVQGITFCRTVRYRRRVHVPGKLCMEGRSSERMYVVCIPVGGGLNVDDTQIIRLE